MIKIEDLLEKITDDFVIELMKENGSGLYGTTIDNRSGQKCLWFRTICHGGDSHKLCYFTESKDFFCYTNCGRMPFFTFIKTIKNVRDDDFYSNVVLYIANKLGIKNNKIKKGFGPRISKQLVSEFRELEDFDDISDYENKLNKQTEITKFFNDKILNYFDGNTFYKGWVDEGISIETMQKYNIKWYELRNSIIIPHYNINNQLVGIRRRSFRKEDKNKKYMPLFLEGTLYEHPLALNLYGLNFNFEAIKEQKRIIFVEGEKSVLLSDTYYGDNSIAVATCGFNISEWQIKAIYDYVEEVYIAFDKDYDSTLKNIYQQNPDIYREYLRYEEKFKSLAKKFNGRCVVKRIKDDKNLLDIKDSPFDKGKNVLEYLMKRAKVIKNG